MRPTCLWPDLNQIRRQNQLSRLGSWSPILPLSHGVSCYCVIGNFYGDSASSSTRRKDIRQQRSGRSWNSPYGIEYWGFNHLDCHTCPAPSVPVAPWSVSMNLQCLPTGGAASCWFLLTLPPTWAHTVMELIHCLLVLELLRKSLEAASMFRWHLVSGSTQPPGGSIAVEPFPSPTPNAAFHFQSHWSKSRHRAGLQPWSLI